VGQNLKFFKFLSTIKREKVYIFKIFTQMCTFMGFEKSICKNCFKIIKLLNIPLRFYRGNVTEIPARFIALPALFIHYYVLPLWHWHCVSPCFWLFVLFFVCFYLPSLCALVSGCCCCFVAPSPQRNFN